LETFEQARSKILARMTDGPEHENFVGAYLAVFYRHKASQEYSADFIKEIQKPDTLENRYEQERALFGFFTSALASLESFYFGLYFVGWLLSPGVFKHVANPKRITFERTVEGFREAFPNDPFSSTLTTVCNDVQLDELEAIRNILTHRVVPGRIRHLSLEFGGDPAQPPVQRPDTWKILSELRIDENLTRPRLKWLTDTLTLLIEETARFANKHL
jgi:hypothetical protein